MSNTTSNTTVSLSDSIGNQSDVTGGDPIGKHLHVQVETGYTQDIATGTNTTLESSLPYYVMAWNI